jgi:hypothetical protein
MDNVYLLLESVDKEKINICADKIKNQFNLDDNELSNILSKYIFKDEINNVMKNNEYSSVRIFDKEGVTMSINKRKSKYILQLFPFIMENNELKMIYKSDLIDNFSKKFKKLYHDEEPEDTIPLKKSEISGILDKVLRFDNVYVSYAPNKFENPNRFVITNKIINIYD